jgi:hypothetical protein
MWRPNEPVVEDISDLPGIDPQRKRRRSRRPRLLIEPMIGYRIGSTVSDRGQKLVVAASRKDEHVVAPPTPKLVAASAATMVSLPRPP